MYYTYPARYRARHARYCHSRAYTPTSSLASHCMLAPPSGMLRATACTWPCVSPRSGISNPDGGTQMLAQHPLTRDWLPHLALFPMARPSYDKKNTPAPPPTHIQSPLRSGQCRQASNNSSTSSPGTGYLCPAHQGQGVWSLAEAHPPSGPAAVLRRWGLEWGQDQERERGSEPFLPPAPSPSSCACFSSVHEHAVQHNL
mmetsp:Transcript_133982/g.232615  ORF Transcript_133982/g.232615 Transcript_133982/m.232615 type:complete len:200 (-) Transcript_133982:2198-2797(-)